MITILIGKSASGKDTILNRLRNNLDYTPIVTVTSRPKRVKEIEGIDYNFVDDDTFERLSAIDSFIEQKEYNTIDENGNNTVWRYGTLKFEPEKNRNYVIILDVDGAREFVDYFGRENVYIVDIQSPDTTREARAISRGSFNKAEWDRRLADDNEKYSSAVIKSKLEYVDKTVYNDSYSKLDSVAYEIHKGVSRKAAENNVPVLSYKKFSEYLSRLIELYEAREDFVDGVEKIFGTSFDKIYEISGIDFAIKMLSDIMNDNEEYLYNFFFVANRDYDFFPGIADSKDLYEAIVD